MSPRLAAAIKELDAAIAAEVQARLEGKKPERDELAGMRARHALMRRGKLRTVGKR